AAASQGHTCVTGKGGARCSPAGETAWTPIEAVKDVSALWLTSNIGFAAANGKIVSTWPTSPSIPPPKLALEGEAFVGAASGFRLACIGRSDGPAVCWDTVEKVDPIAAPGLASLATLRASGNALCAVNASRELVCVGEQRRTARSVTSLRSMLREVRV